MMALDEQQLGEVEQRVAEGDLAHKPSGIQVNRLAVRLGDLLGGFEFPQPLRESVETLGPRVQAPGCRRGTPARDDRASSF